jgi:hypothetical protein
MNRFTFLYIAIVLCSQAGAFAQSTIEVSAGIHDHTNLSQDVGNSLLEQYWKPSLDVGVRLNVPVTNSINLTPSVFYNHYLFNRYYQIGEHSDTERVFVGTSGESSNIFRFMVELQVIDQSDSFAKPYFEIGGGYVSETMGTIHGRMEYLKYITFSKDLMLPNNMYFAYTMGVGGLVSVSADFIMDFSIKYYSSTTNRSYCLFYLGLGYKLLN